MTTIRCDIVSAEAEIFRGEAKMVIASGEAGELGIAPRHAPLITRLKPGQVRVLAENGEEQFFYVSGGILEVQPQVVTVLADTAIRARDLTKPPRGMPRKTPSACSPTAPTRWKSPQAQAELLQAIAQLRAIEQLRKQMRH